MGNYAECWLESFYVGSTKDDVDYNLMQLFRASDKRVLRSAVKDLPEPMHHWTSRVEDLEEKVNIVYYAAAASLIKDRLELKGYTLSTAKRAFTKRIRVEAKLYAKHDSLKNQADLFKVLDVDEWLATLRRIKHENLEFSPGVVSKHKEKVTLEDFMLRIDWYGFPGVDLYVPPRLALELCEEKDNFIYDLTDLIDLYFQKDSDPDFVVASGSSSQIIVLTEGSSDGWIISEALKLLYPHLSDYFSFMDFETAKVEGGVSQLAKIVKSFAGVGIVNKVIAIFDNDTAGQEAVHSLRQVKLPGNLAVLTLPDLKALRKYPTIGPSGRKTMNVNGLAASIELYLGDDVLGEGGKLTPVQWSAYKPTMGKYQGEVLDKHKIHKRFKDQR